MVGQVSSSHTLNGIIDRSRTVPELSDGGTERIQGPVKGGEDLANVVEVVFDKHGR